MPPPMASILSDGRSSRRTKKPRCQDCFFHQNMLCALGLDEACPTFRPAHPDGLRPPRQLSFVFRTHGGSPPPPAHDDQEWDEGEAMALGS
jgi:hypothetical protein